jgi:ZIP family zinc transporter
VSDFAVILAVATAAALASPVGGLIALWCKPTSLFMSLSLGLASGVLLATVSFEMMPRSLDLAPLPIVLAAFAAGFGAVYALDLFIHRGQLAGEKAEQRPSVERRRLRRRPRGDGITVLASATSVEELIEGVSIGVGAAIQPGLGLMIALAILIDNASEALSIGELIRDQPKQSRRDKIWRVLQWTGLIGASLFVSALIGWFFLRGLPQPVLGALFAAGGGGMFYLTVTDLLPEAEARQYQQSAALAASAGFLLIFALGRFH